MAPALAICTQQWLPQPFTGLKALLVNEQLIRADPEALIRSNLFESHSPVA